MREEGLVDHDAQPLEVGVTQNLDGLYARWRVVVKHPFGQPTVLDFERVRAW
jgi:hypothetical protein